ncbi:hypothetical protein Bpfe_019682 [Biomphalaria pfeifferi]|uniref:Uncharacterized protein n=1 Tax=Biomphalaria pfeifferi TaxID=112525 RepID=A0AAD8BAN6_BIOPF|nr:hypothetical protein Bpfe_019682 [Biomphalaria pfeifferi]
MDRGIVVSHHVIMTERNFDKSRSGGQVVDIAISDKIYRQSQSNNVCFVLGRVEMPFKLSTWQIYPRNKTGRKEETSRGGGYTKSTRAKLYMGPGLTHF